MERQWSHVTACAVDLYLPKPSIVKSGRLNCSFLIDFHRESSLMICPLKTYLKPSPASRIRAWYLGVATSGQHPAPKSFVEMLSEGTHLNHILLKSCRYLQDP